MKLVALLVLFATVAPSQECSAHPVYDPSVSADSNLSAPGPRTWKQLARSWEFDPWVVIPLSLSAYWYGMGSYRIWRKAGFNHGIRGWEATAFWSGWLSLVIALVSPLHAWGSMLFSVHMIQHEVLMLVAAPLLVLGKPLVGILRGMPIEAARDLARLGNGKALSALSRVLLHPLNAWFLHASLLWLWHVPALFQATLTSDLVHALQHLSFTGSALLFWWAFLQGPSRALNFGAAVLYMFTTALHSGALGALITVARNVWYPAYDRTAPLWGLTALEDQQLGGAVMWIPACTVYIFGGLALAASSLRASAERARKNEMLDGSLQTKATA